MDATPSRITPLGIIAAFVTLTQTTMVYAVTKATGGVQIWLVVFLFFYAFLVTAAFFFFLWYRPLHLYSPAESGGADQIMKTVYRTQRPPEAMTVAQTKEEERIVGKWEHSVDGRKGVNTLLKSGWINQERSGAIWILEGRHLKLIWPTSDAQVGAWIDKCEVSPDDRSYEGRNQVNSVILGTKLD